MDWTMYWFMFPVSILGVAVPVAIVGALILALLKEHELLLQGCYAVLMLALCPIVLRGIGASD